MLPALHQALGDAHAALGEHLQAGLDATMTPTQKVNFLVNIGKIFQLVLTNLPAIIAIFSAAGAAPVMPAEPVPAAQAKSPT